LYAFNTGLPIAPMTTASSSSIHPMLNIAIKAARAAGSIINRAALDVESVRVSKKMENDFVTEVDQASENTIIETLLNAYPDHGILAEESGRTHGNPDAEHVWIIDPLDGTTNFIHGFPFYCVSIALQSRGRLEQAVVYDPTRNDLFTSTRGRGAFRMMSQVMTRTAGLRRPGAAALDLAYVAAGFSDGFFETGLHPWDMAAGALLVTEAGGLVGNFTGEADFLQQRECLAANPKIYGQLVTLLQPYSKFAGAVDKATAAKAIEDVSKMIESGQ